MTRSADEFAKQLTRAVREISIRQSKKIQIVQNEIGQAVGRKGGTAIEHWRKGHFPRRMRDVENLTTELVDRGGLSSRDEAELFLQYAGHPDIAEFCNKLFPNEAFPIGGELSPFVVGWPIIEPQQFFGRDYELSLIFDLLRRPPMQNVAIIGGRRSGKTSMLHYLKNITTTPSHQLRSRQRANWLPHPEQYQWVFVEFEDPRMGKKERLFKHILDGLGIQQDPAPADLYDFLDAVSENLERPSVILMDEIGAGLASPDLDQEFWWSLRSLSSNQTQGRLAFILTAKEAPHQLADEHGKPSPFFNIFGHTFTLGVFTKTEALSLIHSSPKPFPEADIEWIMEKSQCWPAPLQILCHARLASLEHGQDNDSWKKQALQQLAPLQQFM